MKNFASKQFLFRLFPLFLIVYEFCTNMSNDMYLPALTLITADFGSKINLVQLTITAWLAGNAAVQLIVGPLSDRFGRRPILFGGGLLFLLATLGCSLAPSLEFLVFSRFLQGIGVCTMMVSGYASIHDLYNDKEAIHILVWMGTAAVLAPAIGPVLGGVLLLVTNWRMIFLSLFALGAISLSALWFCMPESTSLQSRKPLNMKTLITTYRKILTNFPFIISASVFGLLYGGIMGWITTSPFILISTLKMSPAQFGYLQFPIFGAYIIGAQLVKQLVEKRNLEQLIHSGLIISCLAGLALILFSFLAPSNFLSFVIPMTGYAFGFGFAAAPLNRITLTATAEQKGTAMAVFYLIMIGSGTVISLILSVPNQTVFYSSLVIAASVFVGFILNVCRKLRRH
jgi:DHA1 family multidrug/chloramphenicol efflux transport protein-like MFS transporter